MVSSAVVDANVLTAWTNSALDGTGVVICINDDGLDYTHADLLNVDLSLSFDYETNVADPTPGTDDNHGTACAGVAAGTRNNGVCGAGVAPGATLVGRRMIISGLTNSILVDVFTNSIDAIDVSSNSWGPNNSGNTDTNESVVVSQSTAVAAAIKDAFSTGRDGRGTVVLFAAGNERRAYNNSNYYYYCKMREAICVAALAPSGYVSFYSNPGACNLISAPSSGYSTTGSYIGLVAPRPNAGCDTTFGGTSAATPLVAGVVALVIDAYPAATVRDIQHILVQTAVQVDSTSHGTDYCGAYVFDDFAGFPEDCTWVTNGAGLLFSEDYGFGNVDAAAAVALAQQWATSGLHVTEEVTISAVYPESDFALAGPGSGEPDDRGTLTNLPFTVSLADVAAAGEVNESAIPTVALESVYVRLGLTGSEMGAVGNVRAHLVSPAGTEVVLMRAREDPAMSLSATTQYLSARTFWGEDAVGTWTLKLYESGLNAVSATATVASAELVFYGSVSTQLTFDPTDYEAETLLCAEGQAWDPTLADGAGACTACAAGQYRAAADTRCLACDVGTWSAAESSACTDCGAGFYRGFSDSSCLACPVGTFSDAEAAAACEPCGAGNYRGANDPVCLSCDVGYWSGTIAEACTACRRGTYRASLSDFGCTSCPANSYTADTACTSSDSCLLCDAGSASAAGSSVCTACPLGTYRAAGSVDGCVSCDDGETTVYLSSTAADACVPLPPQQFGAWATLRAGGYNAYIALGGAFVVGLVIMGLVRCCGKSTDRNIIVSGAQYANPMSRGLM
jgi:subtilisin family serine protease